MFVLSSGKLVKLERKKWVKVGGGGIEMTLSTILSVTWRKIYENGRKLAVEFVQFYQKTQVVFYLNFFTFPGCCISLFIHCIVHKLTHVYKCMFMCMDYFCLRNLPAAWYIVLVQWFEKMARKLKLK